MDLRFIKKSPYVSMKNSELFQRRKAGDSDKLIASADEDSMVSPQALKRTTKCSVVKIIAIILVVALLSHICLIGSLSYSISTTVKPQWYNSFLSNIWGYLKQTASTVHSASNTVTSSVNNMNTLPNAVNVDTNNPNILNDVAVSTFNDAIFNDAILHCDKIYSSTSYIDIENRIFVLRRDEKLHNSLYNLSVQYEKNYKWELSMKTGKNGIHTPMKRCIIEITPKDPKIPSYKKHYIFFSSKPYEKPLLPLSVAQDYIFRPLLAFIDPNCVEPNRIWYLTASMEAIGNRESYTSGDVSAIIKDTITGINLAHKAGYLVDDFTKLDIFVKTSMPTKESEYFGPINGSLIFDNGNFVNSTSLSDEVKENYVESLKIFLRNTMTSLLDQQNSQTGKMFINGVQINSLDEKTRDFYFIVSNLVENKVTSISELLEHPFITGEPMKETDRCGKRPMSGILRSIENS